MLWLFVACCFLLCLHAMAVPSMGTNLGPEPADVNGDGGRPDWDLWHEHLQMDHLADDRNLLTLTESIDHAEQQVDDHNEARGHPQVVLTERTGWVTYPRHVEHPQVPWGEVVSALQLTYERDNVMWPHLDMRGAWIQTWPIDTIHDFQALRIPLLGMVSSFPSLVEVFSPNRIGCMPPKKFLHGSPGGLSQNILSTGRLVHGHETHNSIVGVYLSIHLPTALHYATRKNKPLELSAPNGKVIQVETVYEVINIQRNATLLKPKGSQFVARIAAATKISHVLLFSPRYAEIGG